MNNCDSISTHSESQKKFIKLEHIQGIQTSTHNIRLVLFIRGVGNSHIILSPVAQLKRENDAFYDFGRSCAD